MKRINWLPAAALLAAAIACRAQDPAAAPNKAGAQRTALNAWGRHFNVVSREGYQPLTGAERWRICWRSSYASPGTLLRAGAPALADHLDNRPGVWRQGMKGYSRRFANRIARVAIQDSLSHGFAAALGYEVRYVKCGRTGFWPRLGHAIAWNFLTLDQHGTTTVNTPRVGSAFAAEFIGNAWMPAGYRTHAEAFRGVGIQLGIGALSNAVREFAPRGGGR